MTVVAVSANNTRVEDGENATGWSSIGGGPGGAAEGSFFYQGALLFNRKVTSSTGAGFYYTPTSDGGSAQDMTAAATKTWLAKVIVTDYGGLQPTNGFRLRIGSSSTAYYEYVVAGTNSPLSAYQTYPAQGGFIIIPIDPNIAGYRDSTSGTPTLTSVDYFATVAAFASSQAKSENVGCDAIDLGTGLTLVGGGGADPAGTFDDYVSFDQGTVNNRYGYVRKVNGTILAFGTLTIGTATAAVFTDTSSIVMFPDGYFAAGWSGVAVDLQNASTAVTIGAQLIGLGDATVVDTRPDHTVTGTAGTYAFTGQLLSHRNVTVADNPTNITFSNCVVECVLLASGSSGGRINFQNSTLRTLSTSGVATMVLGAGSGSFDLPTSTFTNNTVEQGGTGHAIEITATGTYTFDSLTFSGYGADGTNDAAVYNSSGGAVTINVIGSGNTPTVRNSTGSSTTVNLSKSLVVSGMVDGSEVTVVRQSDGVQLFHTESTSGGTVAYTHDGSGTVVDVYVNHLTKKWLEAATGLVLDQDRTVTVVQQDDLVYNNPA